MTDRRLWLVAALLALAGIVLNIVFWITRQRTNEQTFAGPPRSDYTLTDFTLNALDAEGKLSFQTVGPTLARRGEDGSIFVTTPDYIIYDGNGHQWKGRSDSAWVNKDGTIMRLDGHAEMHRQAAPGVQPVDVVTRDLTTWP
jgi:lipopolysaccharide export system protein LptC